MLSKTEIDNLWVPFAVFSNTKDSEFTKGDDDSEITITREGNFTESQDDFMDEINIFAGRENKITFQQVYSKTFLCQYELQLYPFDTQVTSRGVGWQSEVIHLEMYNGPGAEGPGESLHQPDPEERDHGE